MPPAGRPLLAEYATTIAGWGWELALLPEVPPRWPPILAAVAGVAVGGRYRCARGAVCSAVIVPSSGS